MASMSASTPSRPSALSSSSASSPSALLQQLVRRFIGARVASHEFAAKEQLLLAMAENLLSSSLSPTVALTSPDGARGAVVELCQRRLAVNDPSLQKAVRFSALAAAFLSLNEQVTSKEYGSVVVVGGERYRHKVSLLYFLLRVSEKASSFSGGGLASINAGKSLFELVKKPEDQIRSSVAQINAKIHSSLHAGEQTPSRSNAAEAATSMASPITNQSAWEQFEGIKRRDYGVGEEALMRDLIYVLQGMEGTIMQYRASDGRYVVCDRLEGSVARPIKSLVEKMGAIGANFRAIQHCISSSSSSNGTCEQAGIIRQSFCRAVAQELNEYLKLVAFLETSLNGVPGPEGPSGSVTLKRVVFWFHDASLLLGFLRELVEEAVTFRGGSLLSFLEQFRQHGNERMRAVVARILDQMLVPFGEMLQEWLDEGNLADPYGEFFVAGSKGDAPAGGAHELAPFVNGTELWQQRFSLRLGELPKFIPEALAQRALIAGKTRKFIQAFRRNPPTYLRYQDVSMEDGAQAGADSGPGSPGAAGTPSAAAPSAAAPPAAAPSAADYTYSTRASLLDRLGAEMTTAYRQACRQVRQILVEQCRLFEQLAVIKRYVLFEKGDFSTNLMDLLWDGLNRPAGSLFRHNLVGVLEAAVRATRSARDADWILAGLDVRLLQGVGDGSAGAGASAGASGWDVFALDYRVAFPVDCILDAASMQEYARLSRHIWALKRLEFVLGRTWLGLRNGTAGASRATRQELRRDLRGFELLQAEMAAFVRQALTLTFEAIQADWAVLVRSLEACCCGAASVEAGVDLDEVMRAHRAFIAGLRAHLSLWATPQARSRMHALGAAVLRYEAGPAQGLLDLLAVREEAERRLRAQPHELRRLSSPDEEERFARLQQGQGQALLDVRAAFQAAARHFQAELDDLLLTLQRDLGGAGSPKAQALFMRLDYNEYHRRRNGFDARKYAL